MNATLQKTLATIRAGAGEQRSYADQCIHAPKAKAKFLEAAADLDAAYKAVEACMARESALIAEVEELSKDKALLDAWDASPGFLIGKTDDERWQAACQAPGLVGKGLVDSTLRGVLKQVQTVTQR